jgi:hypothetical protein
LSKTHILSLFEPDLFWFISEDQFSYSLMIFLHSPLRYLSTVIKTNIRKTNISYLTKVILSNLTHERIRTVNVFHYLLGQGHWTVNKITFRFQIERITEWSIKTSLPYRLGQEIRSQNLVTLQK